MADQDAKYLCAERFEWRGTAIRAEDPVAFGKEKRKHEKYERWSREPNGGV